MPNRYMVIRIRDERSSAICAEIEEHALEHGGLEFPFSLSGRYYDTNTLVTGLQNTAYYTETFHSNCRCSLVPINKSMVNDRLDDVDMEMLFDSSLAYSAIEDVRDSGEVTGEVVENFLFSRIFTKIKAVGNFIRKLFAKS
jgi:hypothetical protein